MGKRVIHSRYLVTVLLIIQTTIGCQQQVGAASQRNVEQIDAETLVATETMATARAAHTATTLPDGRVLVAGGTDERDPGGRYTSAEIFEPATEKWTRTGSMQLPRYTHAGTSFLLPSARVVILGGNTQAEVYDPAKGTFTLVPGDARMPGQFSAATLLKSGAALVTGGYGERSGPQANAWLYQP